MSGCVIALGDPFDGIAIVGGFDSAEEAEQYAEHYHRGETWWIVPKQTPKNWQLEQAEARIHHLPPRQPMEDGWDE